MKRIPESHVWLLKDPVFPALSTIMPDGQPQVHPVWCDFDGDYVRVNTAKGRQKDKNLVREPRATLLLVDPEDPYFWMEIRGEVAERIEGGPADEHIDSLAHQYTGREKFRGHRDDVVRVMYKIAPTRIVVSGNGD